MATYKYNTLIIKYHHRRARWRSIEFAPLRESARGVKSAEFARKWSGICIVVLLPPTTSQILGPWWIIQPISRRYALPSPRKPNVISSRIKDEGAGRAISELSKKNSGNGRYLRMPDRSNRPKDTGSTRRESRGILEARYARESYRITERAEIELRGRVSVPGI